MASRDGTTGVVIAGVGGQGSVLATRILADAARRAGRRVSSSEVHGMSRRGRPATTTVRWNGHVLAPDVAMGTADVVLALEQGEGARHIPWLRPGGLLLLSDRRQPPAAEFPGTAPYPEDMPFLAAMRGLRVRTVPAQAAAAALGNAGLEAIVMLGALSTFLDLPAAAWRGAILESVPTGTREDNLRAFEAGEAWGSRKLAEGNDPGPGQ